MSAAAPGSPVVNTGALERLFAPWEEPDRHRIRAGKGAPPEVVNFRRPSPIPLANRLRPFVREWREANYYGASDTTRELLGHWFERPHRAAGPDGEEGEFRYYFCQREAIETLVFLMEARGLRALSSLVAEYGGGADEALGVKPEDDEWARYAFKLATGAGKTKCMSLAIVWSYFHALRESGSGMARNFVVIAPNLTVFERLREDFRPEGGGPDIFTKDPLVPPEWRGDWNLRVVLQGEAGGASAGGTLYLTNIHRLFEPRRAGRKDAATRAWAGPPPATAAALDRGAELRDRITAHGRAMILNDEAHHVWDPGSAWSEAIRWLHETLRKRGGDGLAAQLDFSATPKDNRGRVFPHVVCDSPLGEAVDAGIVKTPVIGRAGDLVEQPHEDAAYRYEAHLRLGYERWRRSREEWAGSGRMPLLFVMCEDTGAADSIAKRLDADPLFRDLNGRTINLHINLKGKIKRRKIGGTTVEIFEENEKAISDEDMKAIRRISRELDSNESPYFCIVSVLMLREGWDVRNVTTIVPLRSYSSKANILPEQTLGRGLRRMTPPGQASELVAVVEHPAFTSLYRQELEQEGLLIDERDADDIDASTVSIFPDGRKDLEALDIALPVLTAANRIRPTLESLPVDAVRERFRAFSPLPLGDRGAAEVDYEGRHLITDEVVERMEVSLPLLRDGFTAISFFARELEAACKVQGAHKVLAPPLQTFLGEILFGEKVGLADPRLAARLADQDVREHVRAVFVPLIRERTVEANILRVPGAPVSVRGWKPYQAMRSDRRPAAQAGKTLFNLAPCDNALEVAMTAFLDNAPDVAAFARNAGPQALRIDYLTAARRLAFYTPDFLVRENDGGCALVETKGRSDADVPRKAGAAVEWCKSASKAGAKWRYVHVQQDAMKDLTGPRFADLARACGPALRNLLSEIAAAPELPFFAPRREDDAESFFTPEVFGKLPERGWKAAREALELYRFFERKTDSPNFAPVFSALLGAMEDASKGFIRTSLGGRVPADRREQDDWFEPYMPGVKGRDEARYRNMARNLKRGLVYGNPLSVIGLLRSCLDFALNDSSKLGGVFDAVRDSLRVSGSRKLLRRVTEANDFRNGYVAHPDKELTDKGLAERNLKQWVETLALLRA